LKVSGKLAIIVIVTVAALAVAAGFYTVELWKNDVEYGDVSIDTAIELLDDKPDIVIIDVRTAQEYSEAHIEDAVNIPVDDLETRIDELSIEDEILVYCRTGDRSSTAIEILETAGYTKLYHMHEGISVWTEQGNPVVQ
jgi:rhodanese-related sulfurtransferase